MNITGKTKDNIKARFGLQEMGLRNKFHSIKEGNTYKLPTACYALALNEKRTLYNFLKGVKFLDGYLLNIS